MQLPPGAVIVTHPDAVLRAEVDDYFVLSVSVHVACCDEVGAYVVELGPG